MASEEEERCRTENGDLRNETVFTVDNHTLTQICLVARITRHRYTDRITQLEVTDGTASMAVGVYTPTDMSVNEIDHQQKQLQIGMTIRISGVMNCSLNELSIVAHNVKLVHDLNEVTHHLLECVKQHIFFLHLLEQHNTAVAKQQLSDPLPVKPSNMHTSARETIVLE